MNAAILEKQNSPLVIADLCLPNLECGQVLVKVKAAGICGAQIGEISGSAGHDKYLPHLLGHEGAGIVKNIGRGGSHLKRGDHVVMHWRKGAGIDAQHCPEYKWGDKIVGAGPIHTFTEYAIVSENRLTPIDKDIPFDVAALMGCAVTTGLGLINNEAHLKIGQSIAIIGCGGVGLNIVQGAAMVGAGIIDAYDIYPNKLEMANKFGATGLYDPTNIRLIYYHDLYDVVVDCTGKTEMIEYGYSITSPGGRMILVGQTSHDQDLKINNMRQHYCGKTLMDSQGGLTNPTIDIPRYLKLYKAGKLKVDELVTHRFSLNDINKAIGIIKSGQVGKCIITMGDL